MNYRILGKTGLRVSEIGFGAWGVCESNLADCPCHKPTDEAESLRALERAFDLGCNLIDTADDHGAGSVEELIGKFMKGRRDRVLVSTKFGRYPFENPTQNIPVEENVRLCLEHSLRRLGTDYVDLYLWSQCDLDQARLFDLAGTMESLRREGKIRHAGISVHGRESILQMAHGEFGDVFEVLQESFNPTALMFQEAIHKAAAVGLGVIVREPLANGMLTGKYAEDGEFDERDARALCDPDQARMRLEFADRLAEFLPREDRGMAQALIRFCLQTDGVSVVVPGCGTVEQVEEYLRAGQVPELDPEELIQVRRVFDEIFEKYGEINPHTLVIPEDRARLLG
jgi:aryl-alcohol dehydrogenase-like predicted oxidoreductase